MIRRTFFLGCGIFEIAISGVLAFLSSQIPTGSDVQKSFHKAEQVAYRAGTQVQLVRRQIQDLRRPEMRRLSDQLQNQTHEVALALRTQSVDFEALRSMRDTFGMVAEGLDGFSKSLNAEDMGKLGESLKATAAFLEQLVPVAEKAGDHLDALTSALQQDASQLTLVLKDSSPDLKVAAEIHDSLARFGEGLDRMGAVMQVSRLDSMREGFEGLETSLNSGAEQVERLATYSYPIVKFQGLKPSVDQRQFWPEGDKIANGMRKAASGVKAAGKEWETIGASLPEFRQSLAESRKIVDKTRETLALALKQRKKIEPLLREMPTRVSQFAEQLPRLSADLARILRQTRHLKEVALSLRQASQGLENSVSRWPELQKTIAHSSGVLRSAQKRLDEALEHQEDYERAHDQTLSVAESLASLLPLLSDHLNNQLSEEDSALNDLGQSLDDVGTAIPTYAAAASSIVQTIHWLLWLVTFFVAMHGLSWIVAARGRGWLALQSAGTAAYTIL